MGDDAEKKWPPKKTNFFPLYITVLVHINVLPTYKNLVSIYKINVFLRSPRSHNDVITILNHLIAHGTHNISELQIEM